MIAIVTYKSENIHTYMNLLNREKVIKFSIK